MTEILDITGNEIEQLKDDHLRELIGLLCEAEYRKASLSTQGVTWGGNQDAVDGGLDVIINSNKIPQENGFIPRSQCGFQVKKPDMPRNAILKEMRPQNHLRDSIKELIEKNGAYIIVSSGSSTSDTALKNRCNAMKEAVSDQKNSEHLFLQFMDRGQVATWVRSHPSLILWVRQKIGRPLSGWKPYENWSKSPGGINEVYLLDDSIKLYKGIKTSDDKGMSAEGAISELRKVLSQKRVSVRLTGLSGVGKTRLIQALFDERIGTNPLNKEQVFYTDISDSPVPTSQSFAEQLIAFRRRAILIIDNCSHELHEKLTSLCSDSESRISLITVEYDVRDHLPESTDAYRLEPSSDQLIEKLIQTRFEHISQVDAKTIATNSGGNFRIAIALAETLKQNESLSHFHNNLLFERLFWQNNERNDDLLLAGEVCSLVYSFEGTDTESEESELQFLASLIRKPVDELYRNINFLKERDLVQSRSKWRAVLPHAIANWLATKALESIPKDTIEKAFINSNSERLIISFTRRLNYLHDSEIAVEIVDDWLKEEGYVGKHIHNLNHFEFDIFRNIAPVAPEKTLLAIERAVKSNLKFITRENRHYNEFTNILLHLAYDAELFLRSVKILIEFVASEDPNENTNSTNEKLKSLFYIHLSGTHATLEMRVQVIEDLLHSDSQKMQSLGIKCLDAALESSQFFSHNDFRWGARSRDFGYMPKTYKEWNIWFKRFLEIAFQLSMSEKLISNDVKEVLATQLNGLWTDVHLFDEIENAVRTIHDQSPWQDGWLAVRNIMRINGKSFSREIKDRLINLENYLRPDSLLEKARVMVLSKGVYPYELEDIEFDVKIKASARMDKLDEKAMEIGYKVAKDSNTLKKIANEVVTIFAKRAFPFGKGLAKGSQNLENTWDILYKGFAQTKKEEQGIQIFRGFLYQSSNIDNKFYNTKLDQMVKDDLLGEWFPILQTSSVIDKKALERLHHSIDFEKAPIGAYQNIAFGESHLSISDSELARLIKKLMPKDENLNTSIEILSMRFYAKEKTQNVARPLINVAQKVLSSYNFPKNVNKENDDFRLSQISNIVLGKTSGDKTAQRIIGNYINTRKEYFAAIDDYPDLLQSLLKYHPTAFLEGFLNNKSLDNNSLKRLFRSDPYQNKCLFDAIPMNILLDWCKVESESRYKILTSVIIPFNKHKNKEEFDWKPIIYHILENSTITEEILENLSVSIRPKVYWGSRADILDSRSKLFVKLFDHNNGVISSWAKDRHFQLQEEIRRMGEWEHKLESERDESFE